MRSEPRSTRRGMTLIELLVAMGVVGLLIGLLLPAVQAARERARRLDCSGRLGQLIRAAHQFESARGGLPASMFYVSDLAARDRSAGLYSIHCLLLPYLERRELFDAINFHLPAAYEGDVREYHATAARVVVSEFLCPSDPRAKGVDLAPNSYRVCGGVTEFRREGSDILRSRFEGAFDPIPGGRQWLTGDRANPPTSAVRDGMSHTLAFSEKPIGSGLGGSASPFRDWFSDLRGNPVDADEWLAACAASRGRYPHMDAGSTWLGFSAIATRFYAAAPPNTPIPDCSHYPSAYGLFSARSYHPGGVQAALLDGSVRWFSSSTSTPVWRSLATRAGGEIATD